MIRLGIIGTGPFCREAHFPSILNRSSKISIHAIYNRGTANLEEAVTFLKQKNCSPVIVSQPEDICVDGSVDAVLICLPPEMHSRLASMALSSGKHVFCEKPISAALEGAKAIVSLRHNVSSVFHVGFVIRYSNLFKEIMRIIKEGRIGEPKMVWNRVFFKSNWAYRQNHWVNDPRQSGGSLNSWAVHSFDLMQAMAGGYPVDCYSSGGHMHLSNTENTDATFLSINYDNGVIGSLQLCRFAPRGDDWWIGCIGTEGMLEAGFFQRKIMLRTHASTEPFQTEPQNYSGHSFDGMQQQMDAFISAIHTGHQTESSFEEGYYATALALSAEQSLVANEVIQIEHL